MNATPLSFNVATASVIFEVCRPMCCMPGPPCSVKNVSTWLGPEKKISGIKRLVHYWYQKILPASYNHRNTCTSIQ